MIERVHRFGRALFGVLRRPMASAFDSAENPLNHLGAMTIFFLWIVLISGIWLLIFFRTSVSGAFESVDYLTREQWYLGGIMRSLHRYASDGAIITILLHIVKEFIFDRYRNKRWFTWATGVPLVWMIFVLGMGFSGRYQYSYCHRALGTCREKGTASTGGAGLLQWL